MNLAPSPILTPADDGSFPLQIRRGTQSRVPLKVAIIGGGQACDDLLTLMMDERLGRLNIEILGVADPNPAALGMEHAFKLGFLTEVGQQRRADERAQHIGQVISASARYSQLEFHDEDSAYLWKEMTGKKVHLVPLRTFTRPGAK